eukprot:1195164-Prorocentrum_minimum.AAC.3
MLLVDRPAIDGPKVVLVPDHKEVGERERGTRQTRPRATMTPSQGCECDREPPAHPGRGTPREVSLPEY